jgi:hypothetical protein
MYALDLSAYPIDPTEILKDSIHQRVLQNASRFAEALKKLGYSVRVCSSASLLRLPEVSLERKIKIAEDFELWSQWIDELDPTTSDGDMEFDLLRRALDHHGFHADEEFWKTLEKDQIVEFYGEDMVQLFRSFNFFEITGYSLLDISVFEWYKLWDRPSRVLEAVAAELKESLEVYIPVKRFLTPKHIIREIHNTGDSEPFLPRAALAEFLHLGSLASSTFTKNPKKGFICSSIGEVVAIGNEAQNIQFV